MKGVKQKCLTIIQAIRKQGGNIYGSKIKNDKNGC